MADIASLLIKGKTVEFRLDEGEEAHSVEMCPPPASVAKALRAEFFEISEGSQKFVNKDGSPKRQDKQFFDFLAQLEALTAKAVIACFPEGSEEKSLDEDTVKQFVLRIGGDKSEVVRYAMSMCGMPRAEDKKDDKPAEGDTDFE